MTTPLVLVGPGQGAQTVGMGRAWNDASPEARAVFADADRRLADLWHGTDLAGSSLSSLCFAGPADTLNRTDVSQPAIYVAGVASLRGLRASLGFGNGELPLAAAAGLSLGEYTALHAAGAFSFEDGLRLVALRGRAMQDAATASPSSMVALIGADEAQAADLCARALAALPAGSVLVPANFNAPGQIVISGSIPACDAAEKLAPDLGLRATRLSVAGAFHSPLMAPAAERLGDALAKTTITEPRCTVLSNVTASPHESPIEIRRRLVEQLTSPVRWAQCCQFLAENHAADAFHELAPGKTLAGLMRRIDKSVKITPHDEP
jgi:[acyl-carrier-protein] S-malonyltransferase